MMNRTVRNQARLFISLCCATFLGCAGGAGTETSGTRSAATTSTAPCSAEECAKAIEPPISPLACGEGHEKEIGTTCARVPTGECRKVLTCGGKVPGR